MVPIPPLSISVSTDGRTRTAVLTGEVDLATSHLLTETLDAAVADDMVRVVLDFAGVTFINSTGLGAMVAATKRLRALGGDLVLRNFRGIPASALATTGLDRFFTIDS